MNRPWIKFYPADWRSDPRLRMCSLAARGLWMDLISYMHEGQPYGHLTIDGVMPPIEAISRLVACPSPEVKKALAELEAMQVFSRSPDGAIYSRRMVRDDQKATCDAENGKRGGNPKLRAVVNGGVNPPDDPPDKAHMLDARSQSLDSSLRSEVRAGAREPEQGMKNGKVQQKQTPMPENWRPSEAGYAYAAHLGLSVSETFREVERFKNHAKKTGNFFADWDAAWKNWAIKAAEILGKNFPKPDGAPAAKLVHVQADTPQWDAWTRHRGKAPPRDSQNGWMFPSEWPPGAEVSP